MRLRVIKEFTDIHDSYAKRIVGEEITVDDETWANHLIELGYAEAVKSRASSKASSKYDDDVAENNEY